MNSSGISPCLNVRSLRATKLCQDAYGLRDRMRFPVFGSLSINTSVPSNRNSAGRRTAWLRPLRKSLAVRFMRPPRVGIYHSILQKTRNSKHWARPHSKLLTEVRHTECVPRENHSLAVTAREMLYCSRYEPGCFQ